MAKNKEVHDSVQNQKNENPVEKSDVNKLTVFFNRFSASVTKITGGVYAFIIAIVIVVVWGVTGPLFNFSDTWQLVINTGTTIVTFLMVFVIQHSQNKDTIALQLKLDELIAASHASNKLINVENLTDEELEKIRKFYSDLSDITKSEKENKRHSLEEGEAKIEINIDKMENKVSK
ncbi:MAG TPA: low affinity iron permease family protein [Hanamia sp.]|nr:low affinity iron permease family protein [Hanamia sp.]